MANKIINRVGIINEVLKATSLLTPIQRSCRGIHKVKFFKIIEELNFRTSLFLQLHGFSKTLNNQ